MKLYYKFLLLAVCVLITYGFVAPFLISYPSDFLSILGFVIAFGAIPVYGVWLFKLLKPFLDQLKNY